MDLYFENTLDIYIPLEIINEIISRLPLTYLPILSQTNRFFLKEVHKRIKRITNDKDFEQACLDGDYVSLSKIFVSGQGPEVNWVEGLYMACKGGQKELVRFLVDIKKIDNYFLYGLCGAYKGGQIELANFIKKNVIEKECLELLGLSSSTPTAGTDICDLCQKSVNDHL